MRKNLYLVVGACFLSLGAVGLVGNDLIPWEWWYYDPRWISWLHTGIDLYAPHLEAPLYLFVGWLYLRIWRRSKKINKGVYAAAVTQAVQLGFQGFSIFLAAAFCIPFPEKVCMIPAVFPFFIAYYLGWVGFAVLAVALLYAYYRNRPSIPHPGKRTAWAVAVILAAFVLATLYAFGIFKPRKAFKRIARYDRAAVDYRRKAKSKTILGNLPRPLRIVMQGDAFYGLKLDGSRVPIPFQEAIHPDAETDMYFDVYTDRVYYIENNEARMYSFDTHTVAVLPEGIQTAFRKTYCTPRDCKAHPRIFTAHGNYLSFTSILTDMSGDNSAYDITTGSLVSQTTHGSRSLRFWANNQGYLFAWQPDREGESMNFFLTHRNDQYETPDLKNLYELMSAEAQDFVASSTPIYTWRGKTDYSFGRFPRKIYLLSDGEIGIELGKGIVVIGLNSRSGNFVTSEKELDRLLKYAIPLWSNVNIEQHNQQCLQNYDLIKAEPKYYFFFCLH